MITVIIPTRERPDTLKYALRTVTAQTYDDLEIIISDNASSAKTREVALSNSDPRIRYINTYTRVSMSANFEFALSHAKGDYISILGDDDGILPSGLERGLATLLETKAEALGSACCAYRWPVDGTLANVYLTVPRMKGYILKQSFPHLRRVLRRDTRFVGSPMLYTGGLISHKLVKRIRGPSGTFFKSRTPDVFSTFAICKAVPYFVYLREPIMIAGQSSHSTGANIGGPAGLAYEKEENIAWHPGLRLLDNESLSRLLSAVVYESYLQSRQDTNEPMITSDAEQIALVELSIENDVTLPHSFKAFAERWSVRSRLETGVSETEIHRAKRDLSISNRIGRLVNRYQSLISHYRISTQEFGMATNVLEASLICERVLRERPSFVHNLLLSLKRKTFGSD